MSTKKEVDKISRNAYLEQLIDTYQNLIYSVCYRLTSDTFVAEDLAQDTFLSAYTHLDQFDGMNEKSWLCRIATNKCMDYLKSASHKVLYTEDYDQDMRERLIFERTPEQIFIEEDERSRLLSICENLKPPYNTVARLYFYEDKKAEEIARLQSRSVKTVQTQIYRARSMLQKYYTREEFHNGT